jgi:hypothetical protein
MKTSDEQNTHITQVAFKLDIKGSWNKKMFNYNSKKRSCPTTERKYSSYAFLTSALYGVSGQRHGPAALYTRGKNSRLNRRLGGPQSRSGQIITLFVKVTTNDAICFVSGKVSNVFLDILHFFGYSRGCAGGGVA